MYRLSNLTLEKTAFQIDYPFGEYGTSTTGNIARKCFLNEKYFIASATSTMIEEDRLTLNTIQTNLSVILRVYNSHKRIDIDKLYSNCKDTYEENLVNFLGKALHRLFVKYLRILQN
ncbi:hypothetical protein LOD99_9567 [Oopsacas minuta]|uniref:Uncharacterized protein n=1 Tax=Oopsacas minuta TaxID=111878 RepID=A0AAV7JBC1_9METZ|nr:hypothetical protein LOD99_9567 [Oopsacas minuta]